MAKGGWGPNPPGNLASGGARPGSEPMGTGLMSFFALESSGNNRLSVTLSRVDGVTSACAVGVRGVASKVAWPGWDAPSAVAVLSGAETTPPGGATPSPLSQTCPQPPWRPLSESLEPSPDQLASGAVVRMVVMVVY